MPVGLLEAAVVTGGLYCGWNVGERLRQATYMKPQSDVEDAPEESRLDGSGNLAIARAHDNQAALTVMLVGDPGVGKTLFLSRAISSEALGPTNLPRTLSPAWVQADLELPLGCTSFQLLDTPGSLPELAVPFYRHTDAIVLVFDVGNATSFEHLKSTWWVALQTHRLATKGRQDSLGTCAVLAHVIDERRERQVTRREASAWCVSVGLPYFETHPAERMKTKVLAHLSAAFAMEREHQHERQYASTETRESRE